MEKLKQDVMDEELAGMVNRGQDTDDMEEAFAELMQRKKSEEEQWHDTEEYLARRRDENCSRKAVVEIANRPRRRRSFLREVLEPTVGYLCLGAVLLAAGILEVLPDLIAIPVSFLCFNWVSIKADRWLRR